MDRWWGSVKSDNLSDLWLIQFSALEMWEVGGKGEKERKKENFAIMRNPDIQMRHHQIHKRMVFSPHSKVLAAFTN